jgi:hypothetical protein
VGLAKYGLGRVLGEDKMDMLMQTVEIIQVVVAGDFTRLWELAKGYLANLKEMIFEKIQSFLIENVITAGIKWIVSLFNPASAFVRACMMIYDMIKFFIDNGQRIMALVNAVIDSVTSIAQGNIQGAAQFIEGALAKAVPAAIDLMASLLGLGGLSGKIRDTIQDVHGTVDEALDGIFNSKPVQTVAGFIKGVISRVQQFAEKGLDSAASAVGLGSKDEEGEEGSEAAGKEADNPELQLGLEAIHAEEAARASGDGTISEEDAAAIAQKIKSQHPIFTSITPILSDKTWNYKYSIQAQTETEKGRKFAETTGSLEGQKDYQVNDPTNSGRTITDIDSIEGNILWEEKSATSGVNRLTGVDETAGWIQDHVTIKFARILEARHHLPGYENADIGFRFTGPGVDPAFRAAVEAEIIRLRSAHPNVTIYLKWMEG